MAILVVPHIVQVSAIGVTAGRPWASVWHVANAPTWFTVGADVESVARDFANNFQDHLIPEMNTETSITGFDYLSLHSADGSSGSIPPDPGKPLVGARAGAAAPPNVTHLVIKHTGSARGRRRGRSYLPGVQEDHITAAGQHSTVMQTAWAAALDAFWNGLDEPASSGDAERHLAVVHRPDAAREPGEDVVQGTYSVVSRLSLDPLVATQRRRLRS